MGTSRSNEPPLPMALAYFLTWPTYGTWLPGDERGWVEYRHGWQLPDSIRKLEAEARMTEDACTLDTEERAVVEATIAEHCRTRGWELHAVNCRTNHLHVVVTADRDPDQVRAQFKAWCTRRLKELQAKQLKCSDAADVARQIRENWWAERGSRRSSTMRERSKQPSATFRMARISLGHQPEAQARRVEGSEGFSWAPAVTAHQHGRPGLPLAYLVAR
jgi:REP element-mobilizing transposase RayT